MNVIRPAGSAKLAIIEARILSSHRDWETGTLFFLVTTVHKDGSQVLEEDISGL